MMGQKTKQKILVTGGCGYIGSHTIIELLENGYDVISVDNLVNSDENVLKTIKKITGQRVKNYRTNLCNKSSLRQIFEKNADIAGVIHFAALKSVNESVQKPVLYFQNNMLGLLNLVETMLEFGVNDLIFSSSCSVYGESKVLPVTETTPLEPPQCPYARTKVMGEEILSDVCFTHQNFRAVVLRYFNPAGAHPSATMGENPRNVASNLVPVITETAIGKRNSMTVFGSDYDTRDGSCVRDYIHVMDLAAAHVKALQFLSENKNTSNFELFNLGIGSGVTVLEAIFAFEKTTGQKLNYQIGPRRAGDVPAVFADKSKSTKILGWEPKFGIEEIMESAWAWEKTRSQG